MVELYDGQGGDELETVLLQQYLVCQPRVCVYVLTMPLRGVFGGLFVSVQRSSTKCIYEG